MQSSNTLHRDSCVIRGYERWRGNSPRSVRIAEWCLEDAKYRCGVNSKEAVMESSIGMNSGLDSAQSMAPTPVLTPSTDSHVDHSTSTSQPAERVFKQSELNDIVKRAKTEAVERDRRLRVEQPEYAQAKYGDAAQTQNSAQTPYQQTTSSEDAIRKIVADETQRQRAEFEQQTRQRTEQEQAQAIVNKFWNKISTGKEKYQDFEKVTGDIEFARFPNTVQLLAEHIENSADVLYELGKDRFKMAQLESLSYLSPRDAIIQAQRLAQSIKDNDNAGKVKLPNEPLSQLRPTHTGTDSGKTLTVSDYRRMYKV